MNPQRTRGIISLISSVTYSDAPNLPPLRGAFNPSVEMKEVLENTSLPLTDGGRVKDGGSGSTEVHVKVSSHITLKKRQTCSIPALCMCVCACSPLLAAQIHPLKCYFVFLHLNDQKKKIHTYVVLTSNVRNIDNGSVLIFPPPPAGVVRVDLFLLCIIINHSRPI